MFLPKLTLYDPVEKSSSSIDPLGLVPIADRLSVALVPGVRERMVNPRFLSLIAAGMAICQEYPADTIAKDKTSSPLQVFEWYVVQALVKKYRSSGNLRALPGSDKANRAMLKDVPLNASRYLRVPGVFGFYGVYKTLGREMMLIHGERLAEAGDRLIKVWEKEQDLGGYYSALNGPGQMFKSTLKKAIDDGLELGAVARKWSWSFFDRLAEKMNPGDVGKQEAKTIFELLKYDRESKRKEIIDGLIGYLNNYKVEDFIDEHHFHTFLYKRVRTELQILLTAIIEYEKFSRTFTNALESILFKLTSQSFRGKFNDLESLPEIKYAARNIGSEYVKAFDALSNAQQGDQFKLVFGLFDRPFTNREFIELLLAHHKSVQKKKPPLGKSSWLEQVKDDLIILKPAYARWESEVKSVNQYVYFYRTKSLHSFLKYLKRTNG